MKFERSCSKLPPKQRKVCQLYLLPISCAMFSLEVEKDTYFKGVTNAIAASVLAIHRLKGDRTERRNVSSVKGCLIPPENESCRYEIVLAVFRHSRHTSNGETFLNILAHVRRNTNIDFCFHTPRNKINFLFPVPRRRMNDMQIMASVSKVQVRPRAHRRACCIGIRFHVEAIAESIDPYRAREYFMVCGNQIFPRPPCILRSPLTGSSELQGSCHVIHTCPVERQ